MDLEAAVCQEKDGQTAGIFGERIVCPFASIRDVRCRVLEWKHGRLAEVAQGIWAAELCRRGLVT